MKISAILYAADPVGINFECNPDEYDPEASTITARLGEVNSIDDLQRVCHEEFTHWFTPNIAGAFDKYRSIALEIWRAAIEHSVLHDKPVD